MNSQLNHEIWFERWLWGYVPCHWKGWAILLLHIAPLGAAIGMLILAADLFDRDWLTDLAIVPFVAALFSLNRISKRHSRSFGG